MKPGLHGELVRESQTGLAFVDPLSVPHRSARELLSSGDPVFLPVNPVEFHGPHLGLHNDAGLSRGLSQRLAKGLGLTGPLLYCADLEVGVNPVPGPGSRPVPYSEVKRAVERACLGLAGLGARRVVLVTFHGDPLHAWALHAGVEVLQKRGIPAFSPMAALLPDLVGLQRHAAVADGLPEDLRKRALAGLESDYHGGFVETSLALALCPETVGERSELPDCPPLPPVGPLRVLARALQVLGARQSGDFVEAGARAHGWFGLKPFPGYTGSPAAASAAVGEALIDRVLPSLATLAREVLYEGAVSPRPPLSWLRAVTLGGRVNP